MAFMVTGKLEESFQVSKIRTENYKNYTDKFIQLGFAPYLGNYGDLNILG